MNLAILKNISHFEKTHFHFIYFCCLNSLKIIIQIQNTYTKKMFKFEIKKDSHFCNCVGFTRFCCASCVSVCFIVVKKKFIVLFSFSL